MIRKTWRVLVVGAVAAAGLALPGTANASMSACTLVATGAYVPLTDLAAVTGAGAFECLVSALGPAIGDLPDPNAPDQYIDVTLLYRTSAIDPWQPCGGESNTQLVAGVGAGDVVAICPYGPGYEFKVHVRAHVVYPNTLTSVNGTTIPAGAPNGCVHDTTSVTCYADAIFFV